MQNWSNWIYESLGMSHSIQYKIFITIVVFLLLYLFRRALLHLLLKSTSDIRSTYSWKKGSTYVLYLLFLLIVAPIWISELHSIGTFLGLLSAGLAVALKEPISNLFAWFYIVLKKPFEMGDRIQIGEVEGDILDVGFFEFTMLEIKNWVGADQSTGRIIHMPNGQVFHQPVINYNQAMNYIWNEIPVTVTFESDWQKAKALLLQIQEEHLKPLLADLKPHLEKAKKEFFIVYSKIAPTVYTSLKPEGIQLTLRYLCNPKKRRSTQQIAVEAILKEFEQHSDIEFAYPTMRLYQTQAEKKDVFK